MNTHLDAEQPCASEANYFDDTVRPTSTSPMSQMEEQNNLIDETESAINILESLKTDTGHPLQWQAVPKST